MFFQIEKILKDIHGPALTLVLEKLKPYGAFQGMFSFFFVNHGEVLIFILLTQFLFLESFAVAKSVSVGAPAKLKGGKSTANGVSKHGNRAASSVVSFSFLLSTLRSVWIF